MIRPQDPRYLFCYNSNSPRSLVMLQNSDRILQLLLQIPEQTYFVWLNANHKSQTKAIIRNIQSELKLRIRQQSIQELLSASAKQSRLRYHQLVIICPIDLVEAAANLAKVKFLICYSQPVQEPQNFKCKVYYAETESNIKSLLKVYLESHSKCSYKRLPNFLNLNSQTSTSSTMMRSLWAMLNYQSDPISHNMIIERLEILLTKFNDLSSQSQRNKNCIKKFIQELRNGNLNYKRAIYWYTLQSPIFKFVNNLLRLTQSPCMVFYIQPYFKSLFETISAINKCQPLKRQFTCFRGGQMAIQEFKKFEENVGGLTQNLGFLSTSLNKQVTQVYVKNALFIIIVGQQAKPNSFSIGYASISQYSQYFQESQIIFNPLNFFKILSLKQVICDNSSFYEIELELRGLNLNNQKNLSQNQTLNYVLIKKQTQQKKIITCQGAALSMANQHELIFVGQVYWKNFLSIAEAKLQQTNSAETESQLKQQQNFKAQQQLRLKSLYFQGLKQVGSLYQRSGRCKQALQYYKRYLQMVKLDPATKKNIQIDVLNRIGNAYIQIDEFEKSLQFFNISQQIAVTNQDINFQQQLQIFLTLATIYTEKRQFTKAFQLYQRAKQIKNKFYGEKCYQNSQILAGIARIYQDRELYSKALEHYWLAFKTSNKIYGSNHRITARLLVNIAFLYLIKGQSQKSLKISNRAFQILQACYGYEHPDYAIIFAGIARAYRQKNLFSKSLQLYQQSLEILRKFKKQQTKLFAINLIDIASIYESKNQWNSALEYYKIAKQAVKKIIGVRSECFVHVLMNMGNVTFIKGQVDNAMVLYQQSKYIVQKFLDNSQLIYSTILGNIANIYLRKGQQYKALEQYQRSLAITISIHGPKHQSLVPILINIGLIHLKFGNFARALEIYTNCESLILKFYGANHPKYAQLLCKISTVKQQIGHFKFEELKLSQYIKIYRNFYGTDHPMFMKSLTRVANAYFIIGYFEKALKIYKYLFEKLKIQQRKDQLMIYCELVSCTKIIQIYAQTTHFKMAQKYFYAFKTVLGQKIRPNQRRRLQKLSQKQLCNTFKCLSIFNQAL